MRLATVMELRRRWEFSNRLAEDVSLNRVTTTADRHICEVQPCKDRRGFDLISDVLPFGRLRYGGPNAASNAVSYTKHFSRSHDAVSTTAKCVNFVLDFNPRLLLRII
jgi:hypothetical protein